MTLILPRGDSESSHSDELSVDWTTVITVTAGTDFQTAGTDSQTAGTDFLKCIVLKPTIRCGEHVVRSKLQMHHPPVIQAVRQRRQAAVQQ